MYLLQGPIRYNQTYSDKAIAMPTHPRVPARAPDFKTHAAAEFRKSTYTTTIEDFNLKTNVITAAIQWINSSTDDIYLTNIRDKYMVINCEINKLIDFLYDNYGSVTEQDVEARCMEMIRKWLFYEPIQTICQHINEATACIGAAKQVIPEPKRVSKAVTLILNTAIMADSINCWCRIPETIQEHRMERGAIVVVTVKNSAHSWVAFKRMMTKEYLEAKRHHTPKNQTNFNASVNMVIKDEKLKRTTMGRCMQSIQLHMACQQCIQPKPPSPRNS